MVLLAVCAHGKGSMVQFFQGKMRSGYPKLGWVKLKLETSCRFCWINCGCLHLGVDWMGFPEVFV